MVNYRNSKIYIIRSSKTDKCYIGSTVQKLCARMSEHRRHYRRFLKTGKKYISSYEIVKYPDAYIELLEEFPCDNKEQLRKREGQIIRENWNECVNKLIAGRDKKQYAIDNKEYIKKYRKKYYQERIKNNPDKINQTVKCIFCDEMKTKHHIRRHERTIKHKKNEILYYFNILPKCY